MNEEEKREKDGFLLRQDPLGYVRKMILRHADELHKQFEDFEEIIAVKSRELDLLCRARDMLDEAFRGTESVRVKIGEAIEVQEEKKPMRPRTWSESF